MKRNIVKIMGKRIKRREKFQRKLNKTGKKLIKYYFMLWNDNTPLDSKTTVEFKNKKSGIIKKQDIRIVIIPGDMEVVKK